MSRETLKQLLKFLSCSYLSLLNKMPELRELHLWSEPQLTVAAETRLKSHIPEVEMDIPGFAAIRQDPNRGLSGEVLVYYNNLPW